MMRKSLRSCINRVNRSIRPDLAPLVPRCAVEARRFIGRDRRAIPPRRSSQQRESGSATGEAGFLRTRSRPRAGDEIDVPQPRRRATEGLCDARTGAVLAESEPTVAVAALYTIIYFQGVTALRRGENDNCILCRGESSCILPIAPPPCTPSQKVRDWRSSTSPSTSHQFPDDLEVRWLLNVAHMTLGEHPHKVDPRYLVSLDHFQKSEFDIGQFRDIGHLVGVNRFNQAGGGIMDDFDNDGLLDIVTTTFDPAGVMAFYRNNGDGKLREPHGSGRPGRSTWRARTASRPTTTTTATWTFSSSAGPGCRRTLPMRPSLLRNNGNGTFTDVTDEAGLLDRSIRSPPPGPTTTTTAGSICSSAASNNPTGCIATCKNGTFEEVAAAAGVAGAQAIAVQRRRLDRLRQRRLPRPVPQSPLRGRWSAVSQQSQRHLHERFAAAGHRRARAGFSCWAWDYDNDGWLDIFATCYDRTLEDVVKGCSASRTSCTPTGSIAIAQGKGFEDVTKEAGLDMVFATMGSNFGDFDNDGFLDMYLGTGDPNLATLVPNRMFKNIDGRRFAEITASSDTGNLQKGHGVACGDWDRDGNVDIFIQMGGAVNGDKYHNILFQNPGHENHWLTVKLVGKKTNRAAIGARIKVVQRRPQLTPVPLREGPAEGRMHARTLSTDTSPPEAASVQTPSSKRSAWAKPTGSSCWRSTGPQAERRRSFVTWQ